MREIKRAGGRKASARPFATRHAPNQFMALEPPQLPGDPKRQAVPSISGTVYQGWSSIDAWLGLKHEGQVIYLEGAEDFDVVGGPDGDHTVQVKLNADSISLGNARARGALENFWNLASQSPGRDVSMHFLTTSAVAQEKDVDFGGVPGLIAWRAARTRPELRAKIAAYLRTKLPEGSALSAFLSAATDEQMQERLFDRYHWFSDQPGIDGVRASVDNRIGVLLHSKGRPQNLVSKVRVHLESWYWHVVTQKDPSLRRLDVGTLLRLVEEATTAYLPVPVERLPELLAGSMLGGALLNLLRDKVPAVPSPLLPRPELTKVVSDAVASRRAVLLTGTVFKGKSTLAQQVAKSVGTNVWWVNLTHRKLDQVDNLLLSLAQALDVDSPPSLVVIDDLDISAAALRAYGSSLSIVLHRAREAGIGIVLTAQGESQPHTGLATSSELQSIEVPELSPKEIIAHCIQEGCLPRDANFWGAVIQANSRGHPKLVQVRLIELREAGWPTPTVYDFGANSPAADNIRQVARQLLRDSNAPEVVEFLYCASELSILMHRTIALNLAESLGLKNGGDVIDSFVGKWLERIEGQWFRTTPLLQTSAKEVWSEQKRREVHLLLHGAIERKHELTPSEAAALMYHAFFAADWRLLALDAARLQTKGNDATRREMERNLLWLPYVSIAPGQFVGDSARSSVSVRSLQFSVAMTLDADTIPQICERWEDETEQLQEPDMKATMQLLMWTMIASADSAKVPLKYRLRSVLGISTVGDNPYGISLTRLKANFIDANDGKGGIPADATNVQLVLLFANRWVRDLQALQQFAAWLGLEATDQIRQEFDAMLDWPIVQALGAFLHGAWSSNHDVVADWTPWLEWFQTIIEMSKHHGMRRYGIEAAKAVAIVHCDYLNDKARALEVLKESEANFGDSPILADQRALVAFQMGDDEGVLEIWSAMTGNNEEPVLWDPFAYRRPAISAARLGRFSLAAEYFLTGAKVSVGEGFELTRFSLLVDRAVVELADSRVVDAVTTLAAAVHDLPGAASQDGNPRWEAVQRVASESFRRIQDALWPAKQDFKPLEFGQASSPNTEMTQPTDGQPGRTLLLRVQCALLSASHGLKQPWLADEIQHLRNVPYRAVRWMAAEAALARAFWEQSGFIEALVSFDQAALDLSAHGTETSIGHPDAKKVTTQPSTASWFGLTVVGAWMAGPGLAASLRQWSDWLSSHSGPPQLLQTSKEFTKALDVPHYLLDQVAANQHCTPAERCVSAIRSLEGRLSLERRAQFHMLLASAMASDGLSKMHELFNLALAKKLADEWTQHCHDNLGALIKGRGVSELVDAANQVHGCTGALAVMLTAVSQVAGVAVPAYVQQLE